MATEKGVKAETKNTDKIVGAIEMTTAKNSYQRNSYYASR
jgi:hypothetical protein